MSKASFIVSQVLLRDYKRTVKLGFFSFDIYAPTLKRIAEMFGYYSTLNTNLTKLEVLFSTPEGVSQIANILAMSICKYRIGRKVFSLVHNEIWIS